MKKTFAAIAAAFLLCASPAFARQTYSQLTGIDQAPIVVGMDVTQHVTGLNPPSTWLNIAQRFARVGVGTYWWGALCGSSSSCNGTVQNLSVQIAGGLTVVVAPTVSASDGALYQYVADDALAYGGYPSGVGVYLPADATQIMAQGLVPSGTNVGPLTVVAGSSSGQSVANLVECKVLREDITPATVNIVATSGSVSSTSVNRDRADRLTCQVASSTSSSSPTTPSAASGYTGIAVVTIPYAGSVTTGEIAAISANQFNGFAQASPYGTNAVVLSPTAQQPGYVNISGSITSGSSISGASMNAGSGGLTTTGAVTVGSSGITSVGDLVASHNGTNAGYEYFGTTGTQSLSYNGTIFYLTSPLTTSGLQVGQSGITTTGDVVASHNSGGTGFLYFGTTGTDSLSYSGTAYSLVGGTLTDNSGLSTTGNLYTNNILPSTSGPSQFINTSNYTEISGYNTSIGVDIDEGNTSGGDIAEFSLNNVAKSYITTTGTLQSASDRRFKKNINYRPKFGIETIDALKPVSFDWRDTGRADVGFIAQDVRKVIPSAVGVNKGHYYLNPSEIIPALVRGMQQQEVKIEKLQAQIKRLMAK